MAMTCRREARPLSLTLSLKGEGTVRHQAQPWRSPAVKERPVGTVLADRTDSPLSLQGEGAVRHQAQPWRSPAVKEQPVGTVLADCTDSPLSLQGEGWGEGLLPPTPNHQNEHHKKTGHTGRKKPASCQDGPHGEVTRNGNGARRPTERMNALRRNPT